MKCLRLFAVLLSLGLPLLGQEQQQSPQQKPEPVQQQVTVYATRTEGRLEDQPTRIELLGQEEVDEKTMMTPGNIVMMLNETSGIRVQTTSSSLGSSTVRIQGMKGRYTRFLADGLPLFGQQGSGLGLLQIPPVDLGRVEIIKGVASALYGAGAMGGVVNLTTRRPGDKPARDFIVNQTTLGGTDVSAYLDGKLSPHTSGSLLGMGDWQIARDLNNVGWADLAGYNRGVVRPRFFWDNGKGNSGLITNGFTYEDRTGGTLPGRGLPATGLPYIESLHSVREDIGVSSQMLVAGKYVVALRGSYSSQQHRHLFGDDLERDRHELLFAEASIRGAHGKQSWVAGGAYERDAYRPKDVPVYRYTYRNPGIFVQDDIQAAHWLTFSLGARADFHSQYGTLFSPRFAALMRGHRWTSRLSLGQGFSTPSALTEDTEAAGLRRLTVIAPLFVERGRGLTFDLTRNWAHWTATSTLFASNVHHPLYTEQQTAYTLRNLADATENIGVENVATWREGEFSAVASYTFTHAREKPGTVRQDVELTPRHSAGLVGTWERENAARIGVEAYYTGTQRLDDNPYRTQSEQYVLFGFLVEKRFGRFKAYVNAENLGNVRQTKYDPLLRPTRGPDGRWTTDAWAPLDGRVFNGGVRASF
ncbi:TonB-dependent receptor [Granulicella sp. dw_53]|uniref:TonB-dependent receptor plug domain-containing protein n=1 Tax=Granulicella sp. dw_53 TaxID=2719792 RepID=UPI001BD5A9C4